MSTAESAESVETVEVQPPIELTVDEAAKITAKKSKVEAKTEAADDGGDDDKPSRGSTTSGLSKEMKELRTAEDRTLKEIIEGFGDSTAYKIRVTRKQPTSYKDPASGKVYQTGGFLEWVEGQPIDESWINDRYGGGKYELLFRKRGTKGGWEYGGQATVEIAGAPDIRSLPGSHTEPTAPVTEVGGATNAALAMMQAELARANERADKAATSPRDHGNDALLAILREQLAARDAQLEALRAEIRESRQAPPPSAEDKFKDKLLDKLVDGDSARVQSIRTQFESEIRVLKENAREDEKRLRDGYERMMQDIKNAHERELSLLKTMHESAITSARQSYETQLSAAKSAFDTQKEIQKADNARLTRENDDLRAEVKELRAKKDKGLPEMAKEIEAAKDLLGLGDGEKESIGEKIGDMLTNPEAIAAIGKVIRGDGPPAAQQQVAQAPAAAPAQRRVIKHKDGKKYILEADGSLTGPLREKPKQVVEQAGPPPIDPATLGQMVVLLENAYSNGTDPEIVARSAKPHLNDQILMLIRDSGGVDGFLSKVAKLPASSPLLSTQAGRNWVRKVGKALVGDEE